jgi:hypothetical protein
MRAKPDSQRGWRVDHSDFNTADVFNTERDQHNKVVFKIRMAYDKTPLLTHVSHKQKERFNLNSVMSPIEGALTYNRHDKTGLELFLNVLCSACLHLSHTFEITWYLYTGKTKT